MVCTLMHKNIPVAEMEIDVTGFISKVSCVMDITRIPVGVRCSEKTIDRKQLNDWWLGRSIPASRDGIQPVLDGLGINNLNCLTERCFALGLSDQYWICPKGSLLRWGEINFFDNNFSKDMGEILFGKIPQNAGQVDMLSPDNTSDGWLKKKWVIINGKRLLMKGGSGDFQQEPLNELIACAVMRRLNIPHVNYTLTHDNGKPFCLCETLVTTGTDLVPAWRVIQVLKKDNRHSNFAHLLRCAEALGIPGVRPALEKMLVLDYIIANTDRHYNNFGFVRNADTLEWHGLAPIYDSGTALWHDTMHVGRLPEAKPFRKTHLEQIKLVSDFTWLTPDLLTGIADECKDIFAMSHYLSPERIKSLAHAVEKRACEITAINKSP